MSKNTQRRSIWQITNIRYAYTASASLVSSKRRSRVLCGRSMLSSQSLTRNHANERNFKSPWKRHRRQASPHLKGKPRSPSKRRRRQAVTRGPSKRCRRQASPLTRASPDNWHEEPRQILPTSLMRHDVDNLRNRDLWLETSKMKAYAICRSHSWLRLGQRSLTDAGCYSARPLQRPACRASMPEFRVMIHKKTQLKNMYTF